MKKNYLMILSILILSIGLVSTVFLLTQENKETPSKDNNTQQDNLDDQTNESDTPKLNITLDNFNKTITINSIEHGTDLEWSDVEIITGSATLPTGTIDKGDIITNCQEILDFKWIPTDEIFLHVEFKRG